MSWNSKQSETRNNVLTIGLFWILRARLAYFNVFNVSSALMSAGLMQAAGEKDIFKSGHCNPSKGILGLSVCSLTKNQYGHICFK